MYQRGRLFVCVDPTLQIPVNPECLLHKRKSGLVAGQVACQRENCFNTCSASRVSSLGHIQGNAKPSSKGKTFIPCLRIPVVTGCGLHQPKVWILSGFPNLLPLSLKAATNWPCTFPEHSTFLLQRKVGDGLANASTNHMCSDRSLHRHCPFEQLQVPHLWISMPQLL